MSEPKLTEAQEADLRGVLMVGIPMGVEEADRAAYFLGPVVARMVADAEQTARAEALWDAAGAYPAITRDMVSRGSVRDWLRKRAQATP